MTAAALGLAPGTDYFMKDLWAHRTTETVGVISANVPSHGVALYRLSPDANPTAAPPNATIALTGPSNMTPGQPVAATETFADNGDLAALRVNLGLRAPSGWSVTPTSPTSPTSFAAVETGQTVRATFEVVAPPGRRDVHGLAHNGLARGGDLRRLQRPVSSARQDRW